MPEVTVEINDRKYRMACEEGQEAHVMALAERFNKHVDQFKDGFGEVGDNRLTVMAGIAVMDELAEAERKIAALKQDIAALTQAGHEVSAESEELERRFAKRLNETARKVEAIATAIDETGAAGAGGG
jgi:cell division protein ZapA